MTEIPGRTDRRAPEDLVRTVAGLDDSLWATGDSEIIDLRNRAARTALDAGWTARDVADRMGVFPRDVTRWAADATPRPGPARASQPSR